MPKAVSDFLLGAVVAGTLYAAFKIGQESILGAAILLAATFGVGALVGLMAIL